MIHAAMAYLGLALIAIGAWFVYMPAGLVVAGAGMIVAAYVTRFLEAQRANPRAPRR